MTSGNSVAALGANGQRGFSLIELLLSLSILLVVSGVVMSGLVQMSYTQGTITNRSEMHASVRSATELMQQEIGQAGRIAAPTGINYSLAAAVPTGTSGASSTVALASSTGVFAGLFSGMKLTVGATTTAASGSDQETITVTNYNPSTHQITAVFNNYPVPTTNPVQISGAPVQILGTFASGIVPDTTTAGWTTNGSTGTLLKLYGDINGDGSMVYVEYTCDTTAKKFYRNTMAWNATSKPALDDSKVLLPNILANPGGTACFTYQKKTLGTDTYVINVAVTLTVQTEMKDPKTHQYQQETKALLNVSPRNVFEGWQLAGADVTIRIQPMPANVTCLLTATPGVSAACPGT